MKAPVIGLIVVVALVLLANSFFVVTEAEQAIVTQFGEPIGTVSEAGPHLKIPFIQNVNRFEKRIMKWDGDPNQIPTKDKRFIWIDTTARWRIVDPLLFFKTVATVNGAQSRLDDILDSAVRDAVSERLLVELVRGKDYVVQGGGDERSRQQQDAAKRNEFENRGRAGMAKREDGPHRLPGDADLLLGHRLEVMSPRVRPESSPPPSPQVRRGDAMAARPFEDEDHGMGEALVVGEDRPHALGAFLGPALRDGGRHLLHEALGLGGLPSLCHRLHDQPDEEPLHQGGEQEHGHDRAGEIPEEAAGAPDHWPPHSPLRKRYPAPHTVWT